MLIRRNEQKRWLQLNKIEVDLRAARNAVDVSRDMVIRSEQLLRETQQTLEYFRKDFAAGGPGSTDAVRDDSDRILFHLDPIG